MLRSFQSLISRISPPIKEQPLLGRWTMNYSKAHLDRKIYLANHDHCGPCGDIQEMKSLKINSQTKFDEKDEFQSNNQS